MRTTQRRNKRLKMAKLWLENYEGQKQVSAYAKKYKVNLLYAIAKLRILSAEIKPKYKSKVRQTIVQRMKLNLKYEGINEYQD